MLEIINWIFWSPLYLFQLALPLIFWSVVGVVIYQSISDRQWPQLGGYWNSKKKTKDEPEDYII